MTDLFTEDDRKKLTILATIYAVCTTPFIVSILMDPGSDMSYSKLRLLFIIPAFIITLIYALFKFFIGRGYE